MRWKEWFLNCDLQNTRSPLEEPRSCEGNRCASWIPHQQELIFFIYSTWDAFEDRMLCHWDKEGGEQLVYKTPHTIWFAPFIFVLWPTNLNRLTLGLKTWKLLRGSNYKNMWPWMDQLTWTKKKAERRQRVQKNQVVHWLSENLLKIHLPKGSSPRYQFHANLFSENNFSETSTGLIL